MQLRALPCGRPLETGKEFDRKPLTRTIAELPAIRMRHHRTMPAALKPIAVIHRDSQPLSAVSYALVRSEWSSHPGRPSSCRRVARPMW